MSPRTSAVIVTIRPALRISLAAMIAASALSGCSGGDSQGGGEGGGRRGPSGPPEVGYVIAQPTSVPAEIELAGRTAPYQSSEVRPQVTGLIRHRYFTEGEAVRKGEPLYQIDPSIYRASANQALANLASAQANAESTRTKADRYKPLADIEAVSKQDYTDAVANARQAAAAVAQQRAALDTARINLRFTLVPAPISGRIGRSAFTEGALVTASQASPLAIIERLDPIYVDIQQSTADLLRLRRALASGDQAPAASAEVRLKLEDDSDYAFTGRVKFSEVVVDQTTGTVTLRAEFPNPQGLLLPGMFVRARFAQSIDNNAFLIPQQAVSRSAKGTASVYLLGPGNKAVLRDVTATRSLGTNWVVTDGLKPGDRVIVEGVGKTKPGITVKPVPAGSPQEITAPKSGKGQ